MARLSQKSNDKIKDRWGGNWRPTAAQIGLGYGLAVLGLGAYKTFRDYQYAQQNAKYFSDVFPTISKYTNIVTTPLKSSIISGSTTPVSPFFPL